MRCLLDRNIAYYQVMMIIWSFPLLIQKIIGHILPSNSKILHFQSRKHFFPPRPKRKLKRRLGTQDLSQPLSQDLAQPLSQDSGVDTCPSQDLDPGTSAKRSRSKSPDAKQFRAKSDDRESKGKNSDSDVDDNEAKTSDSDVDVLAGQSSQDVVDCGTQAEKCRSISSDRKSSPDSDDDYPGQSSQNVLDFNARKRSRRSESVDRDTKRSKRDTDDESTVQTLVKTISDPSITIDNSVKLTKKVLANTLKEMVTKDSQVDNNMCFICVTEPKSGVFVHGRIAHICCCYKCAMKVWSTAKRCPICNRKVSNVLKAVIT